jgi:hypothetical protein
MERRCLSYCKRQEESYKDSVTKEGSQSCGAEGSNEQAHLGRGEPQVCQGEGNHPLLFPI